MPFWRAYYHLVWTTKNREPLITPEIEPRLYAYIVHKAAELGVFVYVINGWADHIHVIVAIPPHVSVSDLVKQLKGASSHDLNQQGLNVHFGWQRGYGVLTLGQRQKPDAGSMSNDKKSIIAQTRPSCGWSVARRLMKVPKTDHRRPRLNRCRLCVNRFRLTTFSANRRSSP